MFACLRVCVFAVSLHCINGFCADIVMTSINGLVLFDALRRAGRMMQIAYGHMSHIGIWAYGHTGMGMG